jgi:hypothetical protein
MFPLCTIARFFFPFSTAKLIAALISLSDPVLEIGLMPIPLSFRISHPNSSLRNLFNLETSSLPSSSSLPE